jgi:hypothetical protein
MRNDATFVRSIMSIFDANDILARHVDPIPGRLGNPRPDLMGRGVGGHNRSGRGRTRGRGGRSQQSRSESGQGSGRESGRNNIARRGEGTDRRRIQRSAH